MRGLDHIVLAVKDLNRCKAAFEAIGYTTTPNALHPWGTGNSLIQFERNFIEMLNIAEPERIVPATDGAFSFGEFNHKFLKRHEGMSMMVFSSTDAAADRARWTAAGLDTWPLFDFSRKATLPNGEQVTVAFTLAFVTHPHMPQAAWFVCQQHYPEHFWKPQYQLHSNGAKRLERVWMQADEPHLYGDFLGALFDEGTVREHDKGLTLELDYGCIELRTAQALAAKFPGMPLPKTDDGPRFAAITVKLAQRASTTCVHGLIVEQVAD